MIICQNKLQKSPIVSINKLNTQFLYSIKLLMKIISLSHNCLEVSISQNNPQLWGFSLIQQELWGMPYNNDPLSLTIIILKIMSKK